ncbi:UNVERIFIED_ORG: hypothetical protein ABIB52_003411 [Arthrobacter sp. UYCu721]
MLCGNYIFPRQGTLQALITRPGNTPDEISRLEPGSQAVDALMHFRGYELRRILQRGNGTLSGSTVRSVCGIVSP